MIYIVHFCARFQKFCSVGGPNSYEKAFFAPLICEKKLLASVYFCPHPEYILPPPEHMLRGGQKMLRGGKKNRARSARAFAQEFSRFCPPLREILKPPLVVEVT